MKANGLQLSDHLAVTRLKYVRQRSMRNPRWRDAEYLIKFTKRRYLRWTPGTPLEPLRLDAERAVAAYIAAAKHKNPLAERRWIEVRASVDRLIEEAERIAGHRIKPRAT